MRRARLACGIAAPAAFVAAWAYAGAVAPGYRPVATTISRLAERGTPTAPVMTGGFVAFGVLLPAFARELPRGSRAAATVAALGTLGVAAAPLTAAGGTVADRAHVAAAAIAYVGQALAPVLAPRALPGSRAVGALSALLLVASTTGTPWTGALQRAGLGVVDLWYAAVALRALTVAAGPQPVPGN